MLQWHPPGRSRTLTPAETAKVAMLDVFFKRVLEELGVFGFLGSFGFGVYVSSEIEGVFFLG